MGTNYLHNQIYQKNNRIKTILRVVAIVLVVLIGIAYNQNIRIEADAVCKTLQERMLKMLPSNFAFHVYRNIRTNHNLLISALKLENCSNDWENCL